MALGSDLATEGTIYIFTLENKVASSNTVNTVQLIEEGQSRDCTVGKSCINFAIIVAHERAVLLLHAHDILYNLGSVDLVYGIEQRQD